MKSSGTVLYIGTMAIGGTSRARAEALKEYNFDLVLFDTDPYLKSSSRFVNAFEHRALIGPNIFALNLDLIKMIKDRDGISVIWFDKARWLFPSTLEALKKATNAFCIHYTPDPAFSVHTSRHFIKCLKFFDLCVTNKKYELAKYLDNGAKKVVFTLQGVENRFRELAPPPNSFTQDGTIFIGHCEEHYIEMLNFAILEDPNLKIFGPYWTRGKGMGSTLAKNVKSEGVWGDDYIYELSKAKIGLGLLCKRYPDQFTTRSFELPAAGCMLLAERTGDHLELFDEGVEAEFFSDSDEMMDKLKYYLANESARLRMAEAGQRKVLMDYSWKSVLMPVIKMISEI